MATVRCATCQATNPFGASQCSGCGGPLVRACANCGFENPGAFRFCGACGAAMETAAQSSAPGRKTAAGSEGERRHLSVMFCDLMDSTALSEELDPEDLRDTVKAYQELCIQVVDRFEGSVAQYLGDGILVYFGYPIAHEDDARRAAKAGLEITRRIRSLNRRLGRRGDAELALRIGIHTGLVVVGEVGAGDKREHLAMGQTPNVAARLQGLADPNGVVISGATERLVRGYFRLESVGRVELKGVSQPVEVHRVLGSSRAPGMRGASFGLTPLVARERKLSLLSERWRKVEEGSGQVVLLRGEAGIGKSRLVEAFKEQLAGRELSSWELHSASYHQNSAFHPLTEALHRMLRGQGATSSDEKVDLLERHLRELGLPVAEALPLLAALLSLPLPPSLAPLRLGPTRQREKTLETLLEWIDRLGRRGPMLLLAEDLHWMDPSTVELLSLAAVHANRTRLFLLLTFRPGFQPSFALGDAHVTEISVNRLTAGDARTLAERLLAARRLPPAVLDELVERSDGNPLFLEELAKTFLESLAESDVAASGLETEQALRTLEIPHRLHDSLLARLDRLGRAKEVAQLGATLGRSFQLDLLRAVSTLDERNLEECLERLVDADMLVPLDEAGLAGFQFRHSLLQEAAYQSLLKKQRRRYHRQIVAALEGQFSQTIEAEPELLAHHSTEAGLEERAVEYWRRAGERAAQRFANLEAQRHLRRGLELLASQPESPQRNRQELPFRVVLASALMATRGFTAPEVEAAYTRARELARLEPSSPLAQTALRGLQRLHTARGDFQKARELGEEFLALVRRSGNADLLADAHLTLGAPLWHLGRLVEAQQHLQAALEHYDGREGAARKAYLEAISPAVSCRVYSSYAQWLLGFPERALRTAEHNLTLARELRHPMSLAVAHIGAALVQVFRRQPEETLIHAEAGIRLAEQHRIPTWREMGLILRGRALAEQGLLSAGLSGMEDGLTGWQASGVGFGYPLFLTLMAQVHRLAGDQRAALRLLERAAEEVRRTGECYLEAEVHRERGEILAEQEGYRVLARSELEAALEIARQQQARSLELRAAVSLARCFGEFRPVLERVLASVSEGRDSSDHRAALAVLGRDAAAGSRRPLAAAVATPAEE